VQDFLLYDFYTPEGHVNEDVFAYSNKAGNERGLVVYHNKFATAKGWIRTSAAYSIKTESGEHMLLQKRLGEGLGLTNDGNTYCIFRDPINSLDYIRNNRELHEQGLYIELEAYKCQVFIAFREVQDNDWRQYASLAAYLNGRGVPSIDEAMKEIFLQPIHQAYRELVNPGFFRWVISNRLGSAEAKQLQPISPDAVDTLVSEADTKFVALLEEIKRTTSGSGELLPIASSMNKYLLTSLHLPIFTERFPSTQSPRCHQSMKYLHAGDEKASPWKKGDAYTWGVLLGWVATSLLGRVVTEAGYEEVSRSWVDEWMLNKILVSTLDDLGLDDKSNWRAVTLVKLLTSHHAWWKQAARGDAKPETNPAYRLLSAILSDTDAQGYLGVNRYQDVLWFNKESYEDLLWWLFVIATVDIASQHLEAAQEAQVAPVEDVALLVMRCYEEITILIEKAADSGYKLEKLVDLVKEIDR